MKNVVSNFFNGKVSLWKSYWIVGELFNAIMILLFFNIEIKIFKNYKIIKQLPFLNFNEFNFFSKFFIVSWTILITIGIWKSAENYKGNFISNS